MDTITLPESEPVDDRHPANYRAHGCVVMVGDQLLVYRVDEFVTYVPLCVARTEAGQRCREPIAEFCAWVNVQVQGTDAYVCASQSAAPDECFKRQRCQRHLGSAGPDALVPEWTRFHPGIDSDLLRFPAPLWTPDGIREPPGKRALGRSSHSLVCPFGDHLRYVEKQDDVAEDLGLDIEDLTARRLRAFNEFLGEPEEPREHETPEMGTPTALYRWWDADDLLLYVGISDNLRTRLGNHIKASSWMDFAAQSRIERFPSRAEASEAEVAAIKAEQPLFNHQHNDTPEARRRLVAYLVQHGRADLLAPAVSRG